MMMRKYLLSALCVALASGFGARVAFTPKSAPVPKLVQLSIQNNSGTYLNLESNLPEHSTNAPDSEEAPETILPERFYMYEECQQRIRVYERLYKNVEEIKKAIPERYKDAIQQQISLQSEILQRIKEEQELMMGKPFKIEFRTEGPSKKIYVTPKTDEVKKTEELYDEDLERLI